MAILIPREQVLFVKAEATPGTLIAPAAADAVIMAGSVTLNQTATYTDSEEIANSRSILAQARDRVGAGTFSLRSYVRPSGTAGTAPAENALMTALMGNAATVANTSVTYTATVAKPTVSLWWMSGGGVLFARGAYVTGLTLTSNARGFPTLEWTGTFARLGWTGPTTLAAAANAAAAEVTVADASQLSVGSIISIGDETNNGSGYAVTTVNTSTNVLGISPVLAAAVSNAAAVAAVLPTASYPTSTAVEARAATLTLGGASRTFREFSVSVEDAADYLVDEVTTTDFPTDAVPGVRRVSGSVSILLRDTDMRHFTQGLADGTLALAYSVTGGAAGKILTVSVPRARVQTPEVGEAGPALGLTMAYTGVATTAGEDEISFAYT